MVLKIEKIIKLMITYKVFARKEIMKQKLARQRAGVGHPCCNTTHGS